MTIYLQLQCGAYRLLLDIAHVVEVGARSAEAGQGAQRPWRNTALPVVDLPAVLGAGAGRRHEQVVVGDGASGMALAIVDVDHVLGMRELADQALADFAGVTGALDALVDATWLDEGNEHCLLRLRWPFPWLAGRADGTRAPAAGRST